jgi:hypothetical protein
VGPILAAALAAAPAGTHAVELRQPPTPLPETLRAIAEVPTPPGALGQPPADTLRALYPKLTACWRQPEGLAKLEETEITARFSLRRDGSLIGTPVITFSSAPSEHAKAVLTDATLDALRRCTPARITPALGGAIAGRPIAIRFVYRGPRGRET